MTRRKLFLALSLLLLLALAAGVLAATDEGVQRRLAALPHYARAYLRSRRPTVVPPTPPPVAEEARARLLQTRAPATYTPVPTNTLTAPEQDGQATVAPSPTPAGTPTPLPTPTATPFPLTPVAGALDLQGVSHAHQMWNNCGPTTIAMNLSYYGVNQHQRVSAAVLKPNADDKNVSPGQLADYARSEGFAALVRVAGNVELLQRLLSNGFPVIVETWILPDDLGGMGHYRLLTGYDTAAGEFHAQDSYFGADELVPTDQLRHEWRIFSNKYILVYRPEQQEEVDAILGPYADANAAYEHALQTAQEEAAADPDDPFAWFNLGAAYTALGQPELAADAFDEARGIGLPLRFFWYQFEIFEAYLAVGRYQDVIDLTYTTHYTASGHEEAYYYRALAHQGRGEPGLAGEYLRRSLSYNPNFTPASAALEALEE